MAKKNIFSLNVSSMMMIIGFGIIIYSFLGFYHTQNLVINGSSATGTIIAIEARSSSKKSLIYIPIVKYKNPKGEVFQMKSSFGSNPAEYKVGQTVEVLYAPNNPNDAEINLFSPLWFSPISLLVAGAAFTIIGLVIHFNS